MGIDATATIVRLPLGQQRRGLRAWALVMSCGHIGLPLASASVFGCSAGVLLATVGGIRSNTGSIQYIGGFDSDWAEAAYLATHIIGLQSLLPVATVAASVWLIVVSVEAARRGMPGLLAIAVVPAIGIVLTVLSKFAPTVTIGDEIGFGWMLHIANVMVGVPLGIVTVGIVLLIPRAVEKLATAPRLRTTGAAP